MGLNVKVGSFNIGLGAAASTVAVTGVGFTPKAILFWWTGRTESVATAGQLSIRRGMGMATPGVFRATAGYDADGVGTSEVTGGRRNDACILEVEDVGGAADTMLGWADVQTFDVDGFTLEILDQFSTDLRVSYMAFGGTDIDAEIVTWTPTGVAPIQQTIATTNVPKALFNMSTRQGSANAVTGNTSFAFSFATAANSFSWTGGALGTGTGSGFSSALMGEFAGGRPSSGSSPSSTLMENRAQIVSFDSAPNGFTINWLERGTTSLQDTLVLSGIFKVHCGSLTTTTTTGTITASGLAFQPTAALFASHGKVADASDALTSHERLSLGFADGVNQLQQNYVSRSQNTTMFTNTGISFNAIYQSIVETHDAVTGGVQAEASFTGFTADGFTLNMSDADVVTALLGYIAFAPGTNPGDITWTNLVNASASGNDLTRTTAGDPWIDRGTADSVQTFNTGRVGFKVNLGQSTNVGATIGIADVGGTFLDHRIRVVNHPSEGYYADAMDDQGGLIVRTWFTAGALLEIVLTEERARYYVDGVQVANIPRATGSNAYVLAELTSLQNDQILDATITAAPVEFYLNASPGSVPIGGVSAGLYRGEYLGAQPGAVPITGIDATLNKGLSVTAQAGAVSITGTNADLRFGRHVEAQAGAVSITGVNANLLRGGMVLIANPGAVPIVGEDVTFSIGMLLTATPGAVPIVGVDANFLKTALLEAQAGAVPIVGVNATMTIYVLQYHELIAQPGVVPIVGMDAFMQVIMELDALPGVVPIVGIDATLAKKYRLTAESTRMRIIGTEATLIGVEPGAHSTDLIVIEMKDLHHHIGQ